MPWKAYIDSLLGDLRYTVRSLREDRRFAFVSVFFAVEDAMPGYRNAAGEHQLVARCCRGVQRDGIQRVVEDARDWDVALGAQQNDILGMVLRNDSVLIVAGICIGLFASYGLTRFLASQI